MIVVRLRNRLRCKTVGRPLCEMVLHCTEWSTGYPDLVKDVPAHCRGIGLDDIPAQTIL